MSSVGILVCHALELSTAVGQPHSRWTSTARGSLTDVPNSNRCTQLQRLCATDHHPHPPRTLDPAAPAPTAMPDHGPTPDTRVGSVQPLDNRTAVGHPRPADLSPMYPTPTDVPNSNACATDPTPTTVAGLKRGSDVLRPAGTPRDRVGGRHRRRSYGTTVGGEQTPRLGWEVQLHQDDPAAFADHPDYPGMEVARTTVTSVIGHPPGSRATTLLLGHTDVVPGGPPPTLTDANCWRSGQRRHEVRG